ncbi:unnamed protein product, partial [Dicrocoelium dendriticum]
MEADFRSTFVGHSFHSFDEFYSLFTSFMHRNNFNFVCCSSKRSKYHSMRYDRIVYKRVRCKRRKTRSKGIRRVYSRDTDCSARVNVARDGRRLNVLTFQLSHNHRYDIDCTNDTCTCAFYGHMWLPCVHLLILYKENQHP